MARYQVVTADLATGTIAKAIPVETMTYTSTLSAPGAASFVLPLDTATTATYSVGGTETTVAIPSLTLTDLDPWRTTIWIERDGTPVWGGIVSTLDLDVAANTATVKAVGFHAWLRKVHLRRAGDVGAQLVYYGVDQADIARDLIDRAQTLAGVELIDTTDTTSTGVDRVRAWYWYDRENIGELIEQLGQVENGFDWLYEPRRDGYAYRSVFRVLYPRSGRPTPIVYRLGVNVDLLSATVDGDSIVTQVEAVGAGEANAKTAALVTSGDPSYPLLEAVESYSDVTLQATLAEKATARLRAGSAPIIIPTLSVRPDAIDPPFGSYQPGDSVKVEGSHGLLDIDAQYRLTEINVDVDANGTENVTVALAPLAIYGA